MTSSANPVNPVGLSTGASSSLVRRVLCSRAEGAGMNLALALLALAQSPVEPPVLWYDAPTAEYMSGLPVGNGHIGAMILGEPGSERIALNHNRLWRGTTRKRTNPDGKTGLDEFRRLMFDGKVLEANRRAKELLHWQYEGVDNYQPAGDLLV